MRQAARTDANQAEIVRALRRLGCTVQPLHTVGDGCPDLLVGVHGMTLLVEVKDGTQPPSRRQLTPDQQVWHAQWTGGPLAIVTDLDEVVRVVSACLKIKETTCD